MLKEEGEGGIFSSENLKRTLYLLQGSRWLHQDSLTVLITESDQKHSFPS